METVYRPRDDDLKSELRLRRRRSQLLDRFKTICADLGIEAMIEDADQ